MPMDSQHAEKYSRKMQKPYQRPQMKDLDPDLQADFERGMATRDQAEMIQTIRNRPGKIDWRTSGLIDV